MAISCFSQLLMGGRGRLGVFVDVPLMIFLFTGLWAFPVTIRSKCASTLVADLQEEEMQLNFMAIT